LTTEVISSDCNSLECLGGITGNLKINGAEFSPATFIKTTWKKIKPAQNRILAQWRVQ